MNTFYLDYNVTGDDRKRLVKAVSAFAQAEAKYLGVPSCAYRVGGFTIDKTGELVNVQVLQSSGDIRLDAEACRVVRSSPAWTPGSRRGKPVRVTYTFPVIFELRIPPKRDGKHPSGWD